MNNIELKAYLTQRMLSFCTGWNGIENNRYAKHRVEEETLSKALPVSSTMQSEPIGLHCLLNKFPHYLTSFVPINPVFTAVKFATPWALLQRLMVATIPLSCKSA